tara:strand:- start:4972 stop:5172 length:201 start_codon:yes stop_codon:yes gene_type:complete
MAGFKATRGQKSHNWKRMLNGVEIKPCLFVNSNGKKMLSGSVDGEVIKDSDGNALPFRSIQHTSME